MELHEYQKKIANFCARHPRCILSVDMGLGKTASVLAYIEWLKPTSVLIVAPKRVAETVWKQEAEKWGYEYCASRMVIVRGTQGQRDKALLDKEHPYKIISRDNVKDLTRYGVTTWGVLIIDELTSFKSVQSQRSKAVVQIQAERKIGLTGTFLANGAIDIYGQAEAVGIGLAPYNFWGWRAINFRDVLAGSGLQFQKWKLTKSLETLLAPMRDNLFTLSAADYLQIPPVIRRLHKIELNADERKAYDDLQSFLQFEIGDEIVTFDEQQKFCKLQQLCDGFVYQEAETIRGKQSSKIEAVADFCERCAGEGETVLLFYAYKGEKEWIEEELTKRHLKHTDVKDGAFMEKWNAHEIDVLLAHPASAGHGLNLQHGGHIVVWSSLTYNYELFAQANARLARQGQTKPVQIHYFLADKTIEQAQLGCLMKKDGDQQEFIKLTK